MEQGVLKFRLDHRTSSTVSELVAISESIKYIIRTVPRAWSIFTDSKAALQSMQHYLRRGANEQLTFTVDSLCQQAQKAGSQAILASLVKRPLTKQQRAGTTTYLAFLFHIQERTLVPRFSGSEKR
ncbi:hypothetical protein HPB47_002664 [Ixodes persulcatus]|uniref:Uncharacterized protein n=1 Tax=Ixodes persulcatus TaxID=34615 RepID=A0AC60PLQ6_IXOPE|nr:hypothetical protein HPB47_002664 [Ixodes persulcatus]